MTPEQYWDGESTLVIVYREAYKLRIREQNRNLWLQGLYIYEAICNVSPILRAFSKAKKPLPYPKKPYNIEQLENWGDDKIKKKKQQEKEINKKNEEMKAQIFFQNWAKAVQKKFKKKGG